MNSTEIFQRGPVGGGRETEEFKVPIINVLRRYMLGQELLDTGNNITNICNFPNFIRHRFSFWP